MKYFTKDAVYVTNWYPALFLTFRLTGALFRGELQHVRDVSEQKFKYGSIKTQEVTDIRLLNELHVHPKNIFYPVHTFWFGY